MRIYRLITTLFGTTFITMAFATTPASHIEAPQVAIPPGAIGPDASSRNFSDQLPSAINIQQCQIINWIGNRVYTIKGGLNMATHLVFPEPALDVIVGNKTLWTEEHQANHVFIKPNTNNEEGRQTTLTYIGQSNTSYEFILQRVADDSITPCVIVTRQGSLLNDAAWNNFQNRDQQLLKLLVEQFAQQKQQIIAQQQNALDKYRGSIYTGYKWYSSGYWFGSSFVSDVYDDGRWTYIRVSNDKKGVMAIYGVIGGKKSLLQFSYDANTLMYRLSGIFPQIILAYGKDTVTINRQS